MRLQDTKAAVNKLLNSDSVKMTDEDKASIMQVWRI